MINADILLAVQKVVEVFDRYSIPYYIGGSVASSLFGMARSTLDIDLAADLEEKFIPLLKQDLENEYYIDEDMIKDAIKRESSFNLIHFKTMIKIDVFILKNNQYDKEILKRKIKDNFLGANKDFTLFFSSPEDTIINKLKSDIKKLFDVTPGSDNQEGSVKFL